MMQNYLTRIRMPGLWFLVFVLLAPAQPALAQSTTLRSGDRVFGELLVSYDVDPIYARVTVSLSLSENIIGKAVITPEASAYRFDFRNGDTSARGVLTGEFKISPGISALNGDFETLLGTASTPFKGGVVTWTAADNLIYVERTFDLSPEISVRTQISGSAKSNARVIVMAGSMIMGEVNMLQPSPLAVLNGDLVLGNAKVFKGTSFTLTIPTTRQQGQVVMNGSFQSGSNPETAISSIIATWSL
ncbi:MAG: hypothetical protein ACTSV1_04460 [Alphaproteobacteria bacterium]